MKTWTKSDEDNLRRLYRTHTIAEIAAIMDRSFTSVRLKVHRLRLAPNGQAPDNALVSLLRAKFGNPDYFVPSDEFFRKIGVSKKRYWMIYKGVSPLPVHVYLAICEVLNIDKATLENPGYLFPTEKIFK